MYQLDTSDAILLYYLFCVKIIPALVTYLADKLFNIKIKFKAVSLFSFNIQNINIRWAGYEIVVGEIGIRSKFINNIYKKPLCVNIEDVRIYHLAEENGFLGGNTREQSQQKLLNVAHEKVADNNNNSNKHPEYSEWDKIYHNKMIQFLWQYLPPTVMMTLKIFQVRIRNFSTTLLNRDKGPMISVSIPNLELLFDGYLKRQNRTLSIALALQHINSKFIPYNKQNPAQESREGCLAEVVADINIKFELVWSNKQLIFESQSASISDTLVTFYGGLFDIIEHVMLHIKGGLSSITDTNSNNKSVSEPSAVTKIGSKQQFIEKLLSALTPNVISLCAEQIEVKSLDKQSSFHYHLLLHKAIAELRLKHGNDVKANVINLRIYTPAQKVLFLKELMMNTEQIGQEVKAIISVDTLDAVYNHEDIYGWWLKIFTASMKSSRREIILKAIEIGNQRMIEFYHSEYVQNIFKQIILNKNIELRHINVLLELEDQISSISATKVHFILNQSNDKFRQSFYNDYTMDLLLKNRHWKIDIISDGSLCWFMGSKNPYNNVKTSHIRDCALYIGNTSAHFSSVEFKDVIKLDFHASQFCVEYSSKFTKFIEQSAKALTSYVKLFSQLKKKEISNDNQSQSIEDTKLSNGNLEKFFENFLINLEILDFSSFFVNRHDVCIAVNINSFSSSKDLSYLFEMLDISTIDYRKDDGMCTISDITTTYISTSRLKVNLEKAEQYQLCVDFAEKFECSWNAHFIRHCLSIARDFRRFKASIEDALEIQRKQISLPRSLPLGLDIKKLRNFSVKHADVNIDKLMLLINEISGENLFFYNYFG